MIHIATVHWNTDKWIGIQQSYLRMHIKSPYRVYAWLTNIPPAMSDSFYYSCSEPVNSHPIQLNILAEIIYFASNRDDDILIFLCDNRWLLEIPQRRLERRVRMAK